MQTKTIGDTPHYFRTKSVQSEVENSMQGNEKQFEWSGQGKVHYEGSSPQRNPYTCLALLQLVLLNSGDKIIDAAELLEAFVPSFTLSNELVCLLEK